MLGPKPSDEWFVSEGGAVTGPFSGSRLRDLIRWGKVTDSALLCDAYGSVWFPVGRSPFAAAFAERAVSEGVLPLVEPADVTESSGSPVALVAIVLVLVVIVAAFTA